MNVSLYFLDFYVLTIAVLFVGNIYILQEHLDCQSLQSLMDKDTEGNKLPVSTAKRFILDILKGMELIHSYGVMFIPCPIFTYLGSCYKQLLCV